MTYEIHTFGNGEVLKGIFDAIAMCLNGHTGTLFEPLKRLGLTLGTFWAAIYALYGDHMKAFTHWIVPMILVMNLLFLPSTSVWIHDPVTRFHQKVDHVPYGLAAFAGYVSKIGYGITEQIERVFTLPDDLRYQKAGALFASQIIQQARTFHITNEELSENMKSFVGQCVAYDAMLGRKYTIEELRNTDDIWRLVSEHASPVRSFMWREVSGDGSGRGRPDIITCRVGVAKFNALWGQELDRAATLYGRKIFGKNAIISAKAELLKYLPLSYSALGDMAKSATDVLKQHMMIYALVDGIETQSVALGNTPNFAVRRAYLQQRSVYETLGSMAGELLPTMKAVLEAIAYACFLFVIPLALLPFGWRFLLSWGQILLWLQMWAPLYAILNYIMTMAARSKTLAALSLSNEAGVTLASSVGVANLNSDIAAMAGYLAISIPFLCIALVRGVGSFVSLASHLGNVSQSAAGAAASEMTSGNLSFGNISEGNTQIANSSMLAHGYAASYKSGAFQLQDGRSDITTMADGEQVVQIGTSNLPISLNVAESMSSQQSQMAAQAYQRAVSLSESSSSNISSALRSAVTLSDSLSKLESQGDSAHYNMSTEQSNAIHKGASLVRDFASQNQIGTDKAAKILGSFSLGKGVSAGIDSSLSSHDQELYTKAQKYAEDNNFQEAMRETAQASKGLSHSLSDEKAQRLASDISGSYESGIQQREEASKSFNESESYNHQAMVTQAHSASINRNANQEFFDWLSDQPADNAPGRLGYQGASHIIAHNPDRSFVYAERFLEEKQLVKASAHAIDNLPTDIRREYEADNHHQKFPITKESLGQIDSEGQKNTGEQMEMGMTRACVEAIQRDHTNAIVREKREILGDGKQVDKKVMTQQEKGVIHRLGEKGITEVKGIRADVGRVFFGESQQQ